MCPITGILADGQLCGNKAWEMSLAVSRDRKVQQVTELVEEEGVTDITGKLLSWSVGWFLLLSVQIIWQPRDSRAWGVNTKMTRKLQSAVRDSRFLSPMAWTTDEQGSQVYKYHRVSTLRTRSSCRGIGIVQGKPGLRLGRQWKELMVLGAKWGIWRVFEGGWCAVLEFCREKEIIFIGMGGCGIKWARVVYILIWP